MRLLKLLLLPILIMSCQNSVDMSKYSNPKKKHFLPHRLDEISGLAYHSENTLVTVNDEKGIIYFYNYKEEEIIQELDFGKDGDYEGIAYIKPHIFVVKNNGKIYQINENSEEIIKHTLPFTSKNNIEGLCALNQSELLVALKGKGGLEGENNHKHSIYKYNFETESTSPFIEFESDDRIGWSGIAIHQDTIHVLSHRSSRIHEFDLLSKEFITSHKLKGKNFPQPEGICFSPDGTLFISNEQADRDRATILQF